MLRFLRRRAIFFIFTYILTSMLIFFMLRVVPGDPARIIAGGREASEQQIVEIREEFGFDDPIPVQYVRWITNFVTGDWGESASFRGSENRDLILQRTRNSMWLAGVAVLISVPLSLLLGILAGLTENKLPDAIISLLTLSVASLPEFVTGLFLVNVVALGWQDNPIAEAIGWWFPASSSIPANAPFSEALPALWLPSIAATLVLLAYISRLTRAGVIEELKRDYVRTATLKGIPYRKVIINHVLRNALLPTVTVIAISISWLISGLVVIETVFLYPGLGSLLITSIDRQDLPLTQSIVMVTVSIILVANLSADMIYAVLNPRIKLE